MFLNQVDGNGNLPTDDDYDPSDTLKNVLMEVITGTTEKTDKGGIILVLFILMLYCQKRK